MRASGTAHLRKLRWLLQSGLSENPDPVVCLGSERLGTLRQIQFRWTICSQRIRIQFVAADRQAAYWVSTITPQPWGLEVVLGRASGLRRATLSLLWRPEQDAPCSPATNLRELVRRWINERYPGSRIRSVAQRADRAHTISRKFLRVFFSHHGREVALLACDPEDTVPDGHAVLTQAFLWLDLLGRRRERNAPTLLILVPQSLAAVVCHCQGLVNVRIAVWQIDAGTRGQRIERAHPPGPPVENKDFRWPVLGPFRWSAELSRVLDLAPELIRRYPRFEDYDSLRLCGLEFARAAGEDRSRILFGIGPMQTELTSGNWDLLQALVSEILYFRRADSPDTRHPYYTMQAERWLESLILDSAAQLFPELAPEAVYSQIPVYLGKDPGRVDILAVDRDGTLVVMELKVVANPNLPLQALDYWGRVTQHNERGDFERRAYFAELRLTRRQPRIYLVAPVFSYHDSTERILAYMDSSLEIWKVAVNEDWRSGVRVLRRTLIKCGGRDK